MRRRISQRNTHHDEHAAESDAPRSGQVTALRRQVRDPERMSVFLDGEFAFGINAKVALEHGVREGEELSEERVATLLAAESLSRATETAIHLLTFRPRAVREIRDHLRQKGYAPEAIDQVIVRLEGWGYVNDADFARRWIENRAAHRPRGRRMLAAELQRKGVNREVISEALDDSEVDETAGALAVARRKVSAYSGLDPVVARRRLGALLARRGFSGDAIRSALDAVLTDDEAE